MLSPAPRAHHYFPIKVRRLYLGSVFACAHWKCGALSPRGNFPPSTPKSSLALKETISSSEMINFWLDAARLVSSDHQREARWKIFCAAGGGARGLDLNVFRIQTSITKGFVSAASKCWRTIHATCGERTSNTSIKCIACSSQQKKRDSFEGRISQKLL